MTTAAKFEEVEPQHLEAAVASMTQLNRHASHIVREADVCTVTDVTGYGILGHAYEIASASNACICFSASALPMLPGALEYAYRGITTGGAVRNRRYLEGKVDISAAVTEEIQQILFDPQTSGGLLFAAPPSATTSIQSGFQRSGLPLWRVGDVIEGRDVTVVP